MNNDFIKWRNEVEKNYDEIKTNLINNPEADSLFHGFTVWYGPVKAKPEILLLGINPGAGKIIRGTKGIDFEEPKVLEYLNSKGSYRLANEVKSIFKMADLYHLIEHDCIKTNYYHVITKNQKDIAACFNAVSKKFYKDYESLNQQHFKTLISIIQPKVIFCEGASVFHKVSAALPHHIEKHWSNGSGFIKYSDPKLTVIGCSRLYSNIKNKADVAELLKTNIR